MKIRRIALIIALCVTLMVALAVVPYPVVSEGEGPLDEQLMQAATIGDLVLAKTILDKGADVNARTRYGKTALMRAVEMGHADVTKLFLERRADAHAKQVDGWTALRTAAVRWDLNIARLLMEYGAEQTLCIAAALGDEKAARWFLQAGADVNSVDWDGRTALPDAARAGNLEVARLLLDAGTDVNAGDAYSGTPLMEAVTSGQTDLVKLLLDNGADVNAKRKTGWTALIMAIGNRQLDLVKLLLDNGANADGGFSKYGRTGLIEAVSSRQGNIVKLLLDKGADVNTKDWYGGTALMKAASGGQADMVRLLLDKGADANSEDEYGWTALKHTQSRRREITDMLKEGTAERSHRWKFRFVATGRVGAAGGTLIPKGPAYGIRLDSQEVMMRLKENSYVVDATFHFFNTGGTVTQPLGFEKRRDQDSDFISFDAWVDARKVKVLSGCDSATDGNTLSRECGKDHRRLALCVTFLGYTQTTIRVSYEADYQRVHCPPRGDDPCWCAPYEYGTGSYSKDSSTQPTFTIDCAGVDGASVFWMTSSDASHEQHLITEKAEWIKTSHHQPGQRDTLEVCLKR